MRPVEWLFAVGATLFVVGLGFVVVGARAARQPAPLLKAASATLVPIATVRQVMLSIVEPAANSIFDSVGTTITVDGTEERQPRTEDEWAAVANSALALAEAGNLLLMDGRAVDREDWTTMSQAMIDAARTAMRAVDARNPQALFDAGGEVYTSCSTCHQQYMR